MAGGRHARSAVAYARRRGRSQRSRSGWILLGCVIAIGVLVFLFTTRGLRIHSLRHQILAAHVTYEQAWIDREVLETRLASQDDLSAIEQAARKLLGWVMPGEERVIFINPADVSSGEGEQGG